ncbi:hypothetical protein HPP92_027589 [Vanilla planifolia]|uniref:Uncharacterized protein n=1 Tax=Vanilla planifolia TaxID=51239 RepID=A0A835PAF6_VANPL|nr:hypothetical protein HPP92_027589 [Vanilla planifolia]
MAVRWTYIMHGRCLNPFGELHGSSVGRGPMRRRTYGSCELPPPQGSSVDSPRLNASGKVIFQGARKGSSKPPPSMGRVPRSRGLSVLFFKCSRDHPGPQCSVLQSPRFCKKSASVFGLSQLFSPRKGKRAPPQQRTASTI